MFYFVHDEGKGEVILFRVVVETGLEDSLELFQFVFNLGFDFMLLLLGGNWDEGYFFDLVDGCGINHEDGLRFGDEKEYEMVFDEFDT